MGCLQKCTILPVIVVILRIIFTWMHNDYASSITTGKNLIFVTKHPTEVWIARINSTGWKSSIFCFALLLIQILVNLKPHLKSAGPVVFKTSNIIYLIVRHFCVDKRFSLFIVFRCYSILLTRREFSPQAAIKCKVQSLLHTKSSYLRDIPHTPSKHSFSAP